MSQEEARRQCLAWVKKRDGPKLAPPIRNTHTEIVQGQEIEVEEVDMHREVLEKNLFLSPEEIKESRARRPEKLAERRALNKRTKGFKEFLEDV